MLETIKLTKKMLNLTPQELLIKINAVESTKSYNKHFGYRKAFPSHVYVCPADYKLMQNNCIKYGMKKRNLTKLGADRAVAWEFLQFGPNELVGLRQGYILIDRSAIERELKNE